MKLILYIDLIFRDLDSQIHLFWSVNYFGFSTYTLILSENDDSFTSSSKFECFPFPLPKRYGYD